MPAAADVLLCQSTAKDVRHLPVVVTECQAGFLRDAVARDPVGHVPPRDPAVLVARRRVRLRQPRFILHYLVVEARNAATHASSQAGTLQVLLMP